MLKNLVSALSIPDLEIEKETNLSVSQIFSSLGEAKFRDLEMNFINQGHPSSDCLISCGGGLPVQSGMMNILKNKGHVFCLSATPETIYQRTKNNSDRPLLQSPDPMAKIKKLILEKKKSTLKPIISYHPNREVFRRWLKLLFKNIAKHTTSIAKVLLGNFQENYPVDEPLYPHPKQTHAEWNRLRVKYLLS